MPDVVPSPLKLHVLDADDLAVVSAHLQDATLAVADTAFLPREQRFALVVDRLDRTCTEPQRRPAGVHFERVRGVRQTRVQAAPAATPLNLLSIQFEPTDTPSGHVLLHFSGGAAIRLEVECLEGAMADLGPGRPCGAAPDHGV